MSSWWELVRILIFTQSRFEWCEFGPSGASAHMGGWFVSPATANSHPYFHQWAKSALQMGSACPTPFSYEALLWWFGFVRFFPLAQIFCLIGAFWCKFSIGLVPWCALPRLVTYFTAWPLGTTTSSTTSRFHDIFVPHFFVAHFVVCKCSSALLRPRNSLSCIYSSAACTCFWTGGILNNILWYTEQLRH